MTSIFVNIDIKKSRNRFGILRSIVSGVPQEISPRILRAGNELLFSELLSWNIFGVIARKCFVKNHEVIYVNFLETKNHEEIPGLFPGEISRGASEATQ